MKNLLITFMLSFLVVFVAVGQDRTAYMNTSTFYDFNLNEFDTVSNYDTLHTFLIYPSEHQKTTQDLYVVLDSISGDPNITVTLQAKKFLSDSIDWTTIGSAITWAGTDGDTTIVISNATANRYRIYQVLFDATSTTQKSTVYDCQFKVWRE